MTDVPYVNLVFSLVDISDKTFVRYINPLEPYYNLKNEDHELVVY